MGKRINQLPSGGDGLKKTDLFPVWSDNKTEKYEIQEILNLFGEDRVYFYTINYNLQHSIPITDPIGAIAPV